MTDSLTQLDSIDQLRRRSLLVGIAAAALCGLGWVLHPREFYGAYLAAFLFWTALTTGCLALVMLHHLVHGRWGLATVRLFEAGAATLPLNALLFLPLLPGLASLYPWFDTTVSGDPKLQFREAYLSVPGFLSRTAAVFLIWYLLGAAMNATSARRDRSPSDALTLRLRRLSAAGLVAFWLTMTLASVDWGMSLEPDWFSTIYAAMVIIGGILAAMAFAIVVLARLSDRPDVREAASPQVYNDLGNLLLTCVILWAYFSFSQYLITWSGDTSHEIAWYVKRTRNGWSPVVAAIIVLHFAVPLMLLLSRDRKRDPASVAWVACGLLCIDYVNVLWLVVPSVRGVGYELPAFGITLPPLHWLDVAAPLATGGLWIAWYCRQLQRRPVIPQNDPAWENVPTYKEAQHVGG